MERCALGPAPHQSVWEVRSSSCGQDHRGGVRRQAGHSSLLVTSKYVHSHDDYMADTIRAADGAADVAAREVGQKSGDTGFAVG